MGFEPTISAGERPKTYALDRAATGIGCLKKYGIKSRNCSQTWYVYTIMLLLATLQRIRTKLNSYEYTRIHTSSRVVGGILLVQKKLLRQAHGLPIIVGPSAWHSLPAW